MRATLFLTQRAKRPILSMTTFDWTPALLDGKILDADNSF